MFRGCLRLRSLTKLFWYGGIYLSFRPICCILLTIFSENTVFSFENHTFAVQKPRFVSVNFWKCGDSRQNFPHSRSLAPSLKVSPRDSIGGGWPPKGGRVTLAIRWPIFRRRRRRIMGIFGNFGENWLQWSISYAAGAENFDKFRYFGEKSPNFVEIEAFIA